MTFQGHGVKNACDPSKQSSEHPEYRNDHLKVVTLKYRSRSSREGLKRLQPKQIALSAAFQGFPFYLCTFLASWPFLKGSSSFIFDLVLSGVPGYGLWASPTSAHEVIDPNYLTSYLYVFSTAIILTIAPTNQ